MFKILQKTFSTGIVTEAYPDGPAKVSERFRGRPEFDFERWSDARPAAEACPTEAIAVDDRGETRRVTVDYGRCVFCGQCAGEAVRITREFELAATDRRALISTADYALNADGSHERLLGVEAIGRKVATAIDRLLGRALAIREVDAGSCNGCEMEIIALNNPVHDIERFGIHFVASPRHADMLLVTGPDRKSVV
jgi:formate hydrogenlyase subunit 6/NADH:ubiquinone oxidoreductase subunit I